MRKEGTLVKALDKAIELYNKYRSPEAHARLMGIKGDFVFIEFSGSYCMTCGLYDWIEDFVYVLEDLNVKAKLVDVIDSEDERRKTGVFKLCFTQRT